MSYVTKQNQLLKNLDKVASDFLRDHLKQNPDADFLSVRCQGVDYGVNVVETRNTAHRFLQSLATVEAPIECFDIVDETPEPVVKLVVARRVRDHLQYLVGYHHRHQRPIWSHSLHLAKTFTDEVEASTHVLEDAFILKTEEE